MGTLKDSQCKNAEAGLKPRKLFDGKGLYLLVQPNGAKYWRMKYRFGGKEKVLALGVYPEITLAKARKKCDRAREELDNGIDPGLTKRLRRLSEKHEGANTFKAVANEWFEIKMGGKSQGHRDRTRRLLKNDLYPSLGARPINQIEPPELLIVDLHLIVTQGLHPILTHLERQIMA